MKQRKLTPEVAGKLMGVSANCVRINIANKEFPIGCAYQEEEASRKNYYISIPMFMFFTGIKIEAIEREIGIDLSDYMDIEDYKVVKSAFEVWKEKRTA